MRKTAIYLNGIWEDLLEEISEVHRKWPNQALFIQPTGKETKITYLESERTEPSVDDPVVMYASITSDLKHVYYTAEIVDWDNKYELGGKELERVERLIRNFQKVQAPYSVFEGARMLIHVRRMRRFAEPFPVSKLIKTEDGEPLSSNRTRAGGFSYVNPLTDIPPYADC